MTQSSRTLVTVAFLMATLTTLVSGASSNATLSVSVTVVRSCSVGTQPADPSSGTMQLSCTSGAAPSVSVGDSTSATPLSAGINTLSVPTTSAPFASPDADFRVARVNF